MACCVINAVSSLPSKRLETAIIQGVTKKQKRKKKKKKV